MMEIILNGVRAICLAITTSLLEGYQVDWKEISVCHSSEALQPPTGLRVAAGSNMGDKEMCNILTHRDKINSFLHTLNFLKNSIVYRLLFETRRLTLMNRWPSDLYILCPVPLRTNKVLRKVFFQSRPCDVSVLISFPNYDHMVIRSCQVFFLHQTIDGVALCHCFGYNAAWFNSFVVDRVSRTPRLPGFIQKSQALGKGPHDRKRESPKRPEAFKFKSCAQNTPQKTHAWNQLETEKRPGQEPKNIYKPNSHFRVSKGSYSQPSWKFIARRLKDLVGP